MKFIKIIDTYAIEESRYVSEFIQEDNSIIVAVDNNKYDLLVTELNKILNNQEDYENVYEELMKTIDKYDATTVRPDIELEW